MEPVCKCCGEVIPVHLLNERIKNYLSIPKGTCMPCIKGNCDICGEEKEEL